MPPRKPPRASRPAQSTVRMASSLALPEILRRFDLDPRVVLAELGYDLRLFADPDARISYAVRNRILSHCAVRAGCPHLGLLVGQENGLHTFGLVGLLVKYAPDVGSALRSFIRYQHLHVQALSTNLTVERDHATLGIQMHDARAEALDQVGDGTLATMYNVLHELCGGDWKPKEVWCAHDRPEDVGPFRRYFRVPLRFNADQFALLFSAGLLKRRLPPIDEGVVRLLQMQIDKLEDENPPDFPAQLRRLLHTAIIAGQSKADQVAALLGMHTRTLNRRLGESGSSFQRVVDETRFEIARQMLEYSDTEISQIALSLGYAAPGIFSRAFRRWSGTTPLAWRLARRRK